MDAAKPKRRVNKSKPAQRSLKHMRDNGWAVAIVERRIPPRAGMPHGKTIDVWGFGDLLACRPPMEGRKAVTALVQCCASDLAAHRWKCYSMKEFYIWRDAGNKVFLQSWQRRGPRGFNKKWTLIEEPLSEHDFMTSMGFVRDARGLWVSL